MLHNEPERTEPDFPPAFAFRGVITSQGGGSIYMYTTTTVQPHAGAQINIQVTNKSTQTLDQHVLLSPTAARKYIIINPPEFTAKIPSIPFSHETSPRENHGYMSFSNSNQPQSSPFPLLGGGFLIFAVPNARPLKNSFIGYLI